MENQSFLSQQKYQLRPKQSFKQRSFRFFHQVLLQYQVNSKVYPLLLVIQMLQFIHFTVHESFDGIWKSEIAQIMIKILSFIDLTGVWKLPYHDIPFIMFLFISDILLLTIVIIYLYETLKKHSLRPFDKNVMGSKIIVYLDLLLRTILFFPLAITFTHYITEPNEYFRPIMAFLTILGHSLLFLISITLSFFIIQNNPFQNLPFAMPVSNIELMKILLKTMMAIYIMVDLPKNKINSIFLVFVIFGFTYIAYKIFKGSRLIHSPYRYFYEIGIITPIWFSIVTLMQVNITPNENLSLAFLFIGAFGCNIGWFLILEKKCQNLLRSSYKTISSDSEIILYNLQSIRCVLSYEDPTSLMSLQGILNYHSYSCKKTKQNCICFTVRQQMNTFNMIMDNQDKKDEKKCWFEFIKLNLQEIKSKCSNNPQISLFLAYIEKQKLKNKFRALHNLQDPSHFTNGPKYQFLNYHFKRKMQHLIFEEDRLKNEKKTVDINKFLDFQMKYFQLEKQIEKSANDHIKFWSRLKNDSVSMRKILKTGTQLQKRTQKIIKLFEKLMKINHSNIQMLILYGNFMRIVVNYSQIYEKNQENIQAIKKSIPQNIKLLDTQKQKYGDNSMTGIIIISGQRKDIGVIKHCSSKITDLLGYNTYQLVSQNINVLMPQFIGNMHDDVLRNYLQIQSSQYDFIQRLAPMIDKNHYMVLAKILSKPMPSLLNGLQLIGIFNVTRQSHKDHPDQTPKYILYRSDSGYIQALSESCFQQAGYRLCKIDEKNETNVQLDIMSVFSQIEGNVNDLTGDKFLEGRLKIKDIDGSIVQAQTIIYSRHQIFYFGVKLKLLQFFWKKNQIYAQKDTTYATQFTKFQPKDHEPQKNQLSDRASKLGRSQLTQAGDNKSQQQNNEPLSLKILRKLGLVFIFIFTAIACLLLVYNLSVGPQLNQQRQITNFGIRSQGRIIDINFYSRLMHLSQYFKNNSNLKDLFHFEQYQKNLTTLKSLLQTQQFDFVSLKIEAINDGFEGSPQITTYKPVADSSSVDFKQENKTLETAIFDFITSTATFSSSAKQQMNFPLSLVATIPPINTYAAFETFFQMHYTSLYQIIDSKFQLNSQIAQFFQQNNKKIKTLLIIFHTITISILIVFSLVVIPLAFVIVNLTHKIILLFGLLTRSQINEEINNCELFLEIFFEQSYFVRLKRRALAHKQNEQNNSFQIDPVIMKRFSTTFTPIIQGQQQASVLSNNNPSTSQIKRNPSTIIQYNNQFSVSTRLEIKQKKYQQRSSQQLIVGQQNNPNSCVGGANPSQQQEEIIDKLYHSNDYTKMIICVCWAIIFIMVGMLFAGKTIYLSQFVDKTQGRIHELQLLSKNLNYIKALKLYAIQSVIDDQNIRFSKFFLRDTFQKYQQYLLAGQKQLSSILLQRVNSNSQYPIEYDIYIGQEISICNFLEEIKQALPNFDSNSFDKIQCQTLDNGLLTQGYRETLIGYIQTLRQLSSIGKANDTQISIPTIEQVIANSKFQALLYYQKYFEGINYYFSMKLDEILQSKIALIKVGVVIYFVCSVVGIIIGVLVGWTKSMSWLSGQIRTAMKIAGLIPKRLLSKNNKLLQQYQKIEDLLSK